MADLSITAANVIAASNARRQNGTAGATITAGQVVYLDPADNRFKLAAATNATITAVSIALNGAATGQPLQVALLGDVTFNAALTAGTDYYLSTNAGGICPRADVTTADAVILLGIARSTTVLKFKPILSGVTL